MDFDSKKLSTKIKIAMGEIKIDKKMIIDIAKNENYTDFTKINEIKPWVKKLLFWEKKLAELKNDKTK